MDISITKSTLHGNYNAIESKSHLHRLLMCSALCTENTDIEFGKSHSMISKDIFATYFCLKALGTKIAFITDGAYVRPRFSKNTDEAVVLDCDESGTTLRFILPLTAYLCSKGVFSEIHIKGKESLMSRPTDDLINALAERGTKIKKANNSLIIKDGLKAGTFTLPGNVSSQFVSGLLFILPLLKDSRILLTSPLESDFYVDMTVETMRKFGVNILVRDEREYSAAENSEYVSPGKILCEGDWSNAAPFIAVSELQSNILSTVSDGLGQLQIHGVSMNSLQGDSKIVELSKEFETHGDRKIDITNTPDLVPVLAVLAAFSKGNTLFTGCRRLKYKESNRLATVCELINKLGGKAEETLDKDGDDALLVYGIPLTGGTVSSHNDHRLVMAAATAGVFCRNGVIIRDAEAIEKSYPTFFDEYRRLGGKADVIKPW